ncbi:MAG TPA: SpoIID/LytB domain-containing protein [Actinomycetota bacterium]|nr:SpoIID/LytB domain-containing protein [Actinomycetota bacterium]
MRRTLVLVTAVSLLVAPHAAARKKGRPERRLAGVASPIRLVPAGSGALAVDGLHSYFGTVELKSAGDGIVVVNRLALERYLLGLQEVPTEWPAEALRAQAVAARTYALWTLGRARAGSAAAYGFDICATVDCQVFAGTEVVTSEGGLRWARAVRDTAGEAVLYRGSPILARYHSTSGGRTFDNPQVYPGEPDYPYLQGVESTTEGGSPLYRWEVRFRVRHLERMLRAAGWWRNRGALLGARTVSSAAGRHYPDVEYIGRKGRMRTTAEELRVLVRSAAPAAFPGRYPSRWPTSSGRLPETLPSNRIEISTAEGVVRIEGRGWGHGVGMSQWGAEGLARAGHDYRSILAHYYRNTTIGPARNPRIAVGVAWGLSSVRVRGAFSLVDATGKALVKEALGTWTFRWSGAGALAVEPPRGFGLPLEVGIVEAPKRVEVGEPTYLTIALSRPARVRAITDGGSGAPGAQVKEAGRRRVVWLAPLEPGRYRVRVHAAADGARRRSDPVEIEVGGPTPRLAAPRREEREDAGPSALSWFALGLLLSIVAGAGVATSRMKT